MNKPVLGLACLWALATLACAGGGDNDDRRVPDVTDDTGGARAYNLTMTLPDLAGSCERRSCDTSTPRGEALR